MKITFLFIFIIFGVSNLQAYSLGTQDIQSLNLQIGTWLENYGQVRASQNDESNGFEVTPFISSGLTINLPHKLSVSPEAGWVIQQTEQEVSKNIFFLRSDLSYLLLSSLKLSVGTSFIFTSIAGDGGEDKLKNGDSSETYYIPEERSNIYNQTLDLSLEVFQKEHGAKLQSLIYAWNETEQRMYTITLSYIYKLDFQELIK